MTHHYAKICAAAVDVMRTRDVALLARLRAVDPTVRIFNPIHDEFEVHCDPAKLADVLRIVRAFEETRE